MTLLPSAPVLHIFEAPYLCANLTFLNKQYSLCLDENMLRGAALDNIVFDLAG